MQLATQRNFCLIQRKTGQFIAIFGIWNRKRTESVRRFNRWRTEPVRAHFETGNRTDFRFGSLFSLVRMQKLLDKFALSTFSLPNTSDKIRWSFDLRWQDP